MSNKLVAFGLASCIALATPGFAVVPGLQVATSGLSGTTVTVSVHNAGSGAQSARVRVTVRLGDGTLATLTSSAFTLAAGGTTSVSVSAPQSVSEIEDNPEPIGTAE